LFESAFNVLRTHGPGHEAHISYDLNLDGETGDVVYTVKFVAQVRGVGEIGMINEKKSIEFMLKDPL